MTVWVISPSIDNIHGSVTGWVPYRPGSGTYQVNPDWTEGDQFQPGPGAPVIEERIVIVDGGSELYSARNQSAASDGDDGRQEDWPSVKTRLLDVRKMAGALA